MKVSSYYSLPEELRSRIEKHAIEESVKGAAVRFSEETGMNVNTLIYNINKALQSPKNQRQIPQSKKQEKKRELTQEEQDFLARMGKGEVTLDEISLFVQTRAFENILTNPTGGFKFLDMYRTMLLTKEEEKNKQAESWAIELVARSFNGKLPPDTCPKCGTSLRVEMREEAPSESDDLLATNSQNM